ncbi:PLP-dependent transferase [Brevibacillus choshinensis]|uniref:PLP-dependent transferase n=1 Tax=Brevibacillus choshinensis TaxID=54911 RepID=UPI0031B58FEF
MANVRNSKSLVTHPTSKQMSEEKQETASITPGLIRFSIGTETIGDIIGDLRYALKVAVAQSGV